MQSLAFSCINLLSNLVCYIFEDTRNNLKKKHKSKGEITEKMGCGDFRWLLLLCIFSQGFLTKEALGLACNWGTRSTHPLSPDIVVKLMRDNGFNKVKLFEADPGALKALGNSGIQVMLGIPNEFLAPLASGVGVAEDWVLKNVSYFISKFGADIRYIAVGNEPFLQTYKDTYLQTTLPALENIQAALIKAGLGRQVKVTIPLNADVYQSDSGLPSAGDFRSDIRDLMIAIITFLNNNGCPLTINIYPFLSLYADPNFPKDYAFFNNAGGSAAPVVDGSISYTNVMDANFDTLIWALEKNGFPSMPVIIGEIGWPTDGDTNANIGNAQLFNQGLLNRIISGQGTPKRPSPLETYIFGLIDEDAKSIQPGNFERHWGIFYYDGSIKYQLNISANGQTLVPAKGVKYFPRQWCVLSQEASTSDPKLGDSINYACSHADCTSLGLGSSCGEMDAWRNASYAFNAYYQTKDQRRDACVFSNLAVVTTTDPSPISDQNGGGGGGCRFTIMMDQRKSVQTRRRPPTSSSSSRATVGGKNVYLHLIQLLLGLLVLSFAHH